MVSRKWLSSAADVDGPMWRDGSDVLALRADTTSRSLLLLGSSTTSEWNERTLLVSGTT